jgi:hypothetical protein
MRAKLVNTVKHISIRFYKIWLCKFNIIFSKMLVKNVGRDIVVGVEIRYRLDGPGIDSHWRKDIPHLSIPDLGPTQPPIQWVSGLIPAGKTAGA